MMSCCRSVVAIYFRRKKTRCSAAEPPRHAVLENCSRTGSAKTLETTRLHGCGISELPVSYYLSCTKSMSAIETGKRELGCGGLEFGNLIHTRFIV